MDVPRSGRTAPRIQARQSLAPVSQGPEDFKPISGSGAARNSALSYQRIERVAWAVANADSSVSIGQQMEAISRLEAMEHAKQMAEAKAAADEAEWQEEEQRIAKEEELRRSAREASEWEEENRKDDLWDAEQRVRRLVLEADPSSSAVGVGADELPTEPLVDGDDAVAEALAELLESPRRETSNAKCFDCEQMLVAEGAASSEVEGHSESGGEFGDAVTSCIWVSVSHGVLLCDKCGRAHAALDPGRSCVRCHCRQQDQSSGPPLELSDLDAVFAGGHAAFATFLAEEMGVPRRVWLALPIDARYETPASELYARRLDAFMNGAPLPSDLNVPPRGASGGSPTAVRMERDV